jgi:hypothetical protein
MSRGRMPRWEERSLGTRCSTRRMKIARLRKNNKISLTMLFESTTNVLRKPILSLTKKGDVSRARILSKNSRRLSCS